MQGSWIWKRDVMEMCVKESRKMKKGRNKKKEDRTKSTNKNVLFNKGKTTMVFPNERAEKTKKKKTKSTSRILKETVQGKARVRKLAQIASRSSTFLLPWFQRSRPFGALNPTPPQAFRAAFPQKPGTGPKVKRPKKSELVTRSFLVPPHIFHDFCFSANPAAERPKWPELCRATFPQTPREKR